MNISKLYIFILLISSLFSACTNESNKSAKFFQFAKLYKDSSNYQTALVYVDSAINMEAENKEFIFLKAQILYELEELNRSIELFTVLKDSGFKSDSSLFYLGQCYFSKAQDLSVQKGENYESKDNYYKASWHFQTLLERNPAFYDAHEMNIKSLHNNDQNNDVMIALQKAIKQFPDSMVFILLRGVEKYSLGDNSGALADLNFALQSDYLEGYYRANGHRFRGPWTLADSMNHSKN